MIPLSIIPWRLVGLGAGVLAIVGALWWLRHSAYEDGFSAGTADSQAFYKPIIEAAERKAHQAEGRSQALEAASRAVNSEMERQHVEFKKTLAERERSAQLRIARSLRESAARCHSGELSKAPRSTEPSPGTPEEHERAGSIIDRVATDLAAVGVGCEQDAATVSAWQQFYRQQQALMNQP